MIKPSNTSQEANMIHVNFTKTTVGLIAPVLLSACANLFTPDSPASSAQSCERIKSLVADHEKSFASIVKSSKDFNRLTTWEAPDVYPMAQNCKVWEWVANHFNYVCDWEVIDQQAALSIFDQGRKTVEGCLSKDWNAEPITDTENAKHIIYGKTGSPTSISLRYQQSIDLKWHEIVIIGDKANLNVPAN